MKNVILIYPTQERAEAKFREMLDFLDDEINRSSYTPLVIELGNTSYKFINMDSIDKLIGIEINRVWIEEIESLTEEQLMFLRTRYERTNFRTG